MQIPEYIKHVLGRRTGEECHQCEDGHYRTIEDKNEKFCDTCFCLKERPTKVDEPDEWEDFWEHRRSSEEYGGWHGPKRIKAPGGFLSAYGDRSADTNEASDPWG